jgi:hypothetical protein
MTSSPPVAWIVLAASVPVLAACRKPATPESAPGAARTLAPNLEAAARGFGEAVLARNYTAAYGMMAASYREALPYEEFLESIGRYRDGAGELKLGVRASDDDPQALKDDGMVELLVPENLRDQILDEAILDFEPASGEGEGWVLVMWLVDEAGQVRVLNYYQDD